MKSFDEMADDFADGFVKSALPKVVTDRERKILWIGYHAGLLAGIKFCGGALEGNDD